jgi:hypothetical protein
VNRHPHLGVPKSKPRLPGAEPNGEPASKEEIAKLSREYLAARNRQMASKAAVAEMELAQRRGELISRKGLFPAWLSSSRFQTANAPGAREDRPQAGLAGFRRSGETTFRFWGDQGRYSHVTHWIDLPMKVTDPNWLERLEAEENQTAGERLQTPGELKAEQAKVEHRRKQKTETMRRLRAKH